MDEIIPVSSTEPPALEIDLDVYLPLFEDETIPDADKQELLEALWSIIVSFVQLGWGVHPVQQAKAARKDAGIASGQVRRSSGQSTIAADFMVKSGVPLLDHSQRASQDEVQEG